MDKGTQIYQELMDGIVKMSKHCAEAGWARNGEAKGLPEKSEKLNAIFAKLTAEEREVLAEFALGAYAGGIYDVLCELEWYIDCRSMTISVDGELLPTTAFEGLGNDFIGRCDGWEWN